MLSHVLTNDRLRRDRIFRTPRDGIAMSAIRSAFPRQVTAPYTRVPFPTTSSGSAFHVPTALPPWIASRRFFARRRYPRFPSHSLAVVRGYSEDAYLRARPRPRNLGTRLEWIRITLFWARRRSPTSATTNDAQAHLTSVPSSSVNSRNRGSCEHSLPRETLHVVHLRRLATPFWLLPSS